MCGIFSLVAPKTIHSYLCVTLGGGGKIFLSLSAFQDGGDSVGRLFRCIYFFLFSEIKELE